MNYIITIGAFLCLPLCAAAQINRPASSAPKTSLAPSTATTRSAESAPPTEDGVIAVTEANGVEIKLLRVEGNATNQQVTLTWLMNNPKANTVAGIGEAYAVDMEGDSYDDRDGGYTLDLYTDVPKKGSRTLKNVPAKIKIFRLVKFNFWTQATNVRTGVELRNLKIDWK